MSVIQVRPATLRDAKAIAEIHVASSQDAYKALLPAAATIASCAHLLIGFMVLIGFSWVALGDVHAAALLAPLATPALVKACTEVAFVDGSTEWRAASCLRTVCAALDCPLPPQLEAPAG